ncbi:hypothetical protein DL771_012058 [Monosporascus sp. 5C6A]|nr:hypothetical protein DL771_012058 [Monosporascus sp. 5C6A]
MQAHVLSLLALVAAAPAQSCNGFAELCSRRYSEVSFVAAHNAAFVGDTAFHNQFEYPEAQFDRGVRYFTTQVHNRNGQLKQCHSECLLLDAGYFSEILLSIKGKLDANPREVATLLITNHADGLDLTEYGKQFEETGMIDYVFQPDGDLGLAEWPTLGEMIDAGTRLVIFMDYGADTNKVPYILDQFRYYFETPFSPTKDNFYQCDIDRPAGASADGRMIFANHNLNIRLPLLDILVPAMDDAQDTNSVASITRQTDICESNHGRVPNVVMLDFVSEGEAIRAQNTLNAGTFRRAGRRPRFTALSYVWGSPDVTKEIRVNEIAVPVTINLERALVHVYDHWIASSPRPRRHSFLLWVDALCINQGDSDEKNHQIPLMGKIFSAAELVISWLGPANDVLHYAMDTIDLLYLELKQTDPDDISLQWMATHPSLCHSKSLSNRPSPGSAQTIHSRWDAMWRFCRIDYWRRVWVFQEVALARRALIASGAKTIEWRKVSYVNERIACLSGKLRASQVKKPSFLDDLTWLALASDALHSTEFTELEGASRWKHKRLRTKEENNMMGWKISFYGRRLFASDPKDHIYGLVGITGIPIVPDTSGRTRPADVYRNYVAAWLSDWKNGKLAGHEREDFWELFFLAFSGPTFNHGDLSMPSWVLNFRDTPDSVRTVHRGSADRKVFGGHPAAPTVTETGLKVIGLSLDTIVQVVTFHREQRTGISTEMLDFVRNFVSQDTGHHPTGMSALQMVFRLFFKTKYGIRILPFDLIALKEAVYFLKWFAAHSGEPLKSVLGMFGLQADSVQLLTSAFTAVFNPIEPSVMYSDILILMEELMGVREHRYSFSEDEHLLNVLEELDRSKNMAFLVTSNGYIGIARPGVEAGDTICVLRGNRVVSVLRKEDSEDFHVHVSTAHVIGLMYGEAKEYLESGKSRIEVFELR